MTHVVLGRWGKGLALRVPQEVATAVGLHEGDTVEIETKDGAITIRARPAPMTVETMFAGKSSAEWRALYREAFDWGPDLGREAVEE
ncbi:MAG: AbrB/MazE/SpoVT family DNA-binding domain-containing protein [Rhodospirillales bacterium]|nr:AbrB/MazE/SpoVT family DNA-binding domain-containing protein [Rhodospirillales bacterium]